LCFIARRVVARNCNGKAEIIEEYLQILDFLASRTGSERNGGMEKFDTGGVVGDEAEDWVAEVAGVGVETLIGVGTEILTGVGTEILTGVGVEALIGVGVGTVVVFVEMIFVVAGVIVVTGIVFPSIEAVVRGPIIP
jgi:hypothetical protein